MNQYRKTSRILFWLSLAGLFIISSVPNIQVHKPEAMEEGILRLDYLLHFAAYFVIAFLYLQSYKLSFKGIVLIVVYAVIEEMHQYWIPGRTVNPVDLAYDLGGVFSVLLIVLAMKKINRH